jgi:predicted nucleic acid-binding protein
LVAYADTSFLVSLYARDARSEDAQALAATLEGPLAFTSLHRHEARNALRLAIFRKDITAEQCEAVMAAMEEDEKTGVLADSPVAWAEVFEQAEILSAKHTRRLGTRAIDVLHVAVAVVLDIGEFFSFDTRQKALARKSGLTVRPR